MDGDGDVDGTDAYLFVQNYGQTAPTETLPGDFDEDQDVDDDDLDVFSHSFGLLVQADHYAVTAKAVDEDGTYETDRFLVALSDGNQTQSAGTRSIMAVTGSNGADLGTFWQPSSLQGDAWDDTWSVASVRGDADRLSLLTPVQLHFLEEADPLDNVLETEEGNMPSVWARYS
jgi:hypothetical protein